MRKMNTPIVWTGPLLPVNEVLLQAVKNKTNIENDGRPPLQHSTT